MNDAFHNPNIDPELATRLTAFVLGEASAWEADELLRLASERPEVAAYLNQLRNIHGLLREVATGEPLVAPGDPDAWQLSSDKRNSLLTALVSSQATSSEQHEDEPSDLPIPTFISPSPWGAFRAIGAYASAFALACLAIIAVALNWRDAPFQRSQFAKRILPSGSELMGGTTAIYSNSPVISNSAQVELPSPYYLEDDVVYFPEGYEFKLKEEAAHLNATRAAQVNESAALQGITSTLGQQFGYSTQDDSENLKREVDYGLPNRTESHDVIASAGRSERVRSEAVASGNDFTSGLQTPTAPGVELPSNPAIQSSDFDGESVVAESKKSVPDGGSIILGGIVRNSRDAEPSSAPTPAYGETPETSESQPGLGLLYGRPATATRSPAAVDQPTVDRGEVSTGEGLEQLAESAGSPRQDDFADGLRRSVSGGKDAAKSESISPSTNQPASSPSDVDTWNRLDSRRFGTAERQSEVAEKNSEVRQSATPAFAGTDEWFSKGGVKTNDLYSVSPTVPMGWAAPTINFDEDHFDAAMSPPPLPAPPTSKPDATIAAAPTEQVDQNGNSDAYESFRDVDRKQAAIELSDAIAVPEPAGSIPSGTESGEGENGRVWTDSSALEGSRSIKLADDAKPARTDDIVAFQLQQQSVEALQNEVRARLVPQIEAAREIAEQTNEGVIARGATASEMQRLFRNPQQSPSGEDQRSAGIVLNVTPRIIIQEEEIPQTGFDVQLEDKALKESVPTVDSLSDREHGQGKSDDNSNWDFRYRFTQPEARFDASLTEPALTPPINKSVNGVWGKMGQIPLAVSPVPSSGLEDSGRFGDLSGTNILNSYSFFDRRVKPDFSAINETSTATEPLSTFSLHVSDVAFKLALASLTNNEWPAADKIRIEEFVNAFDYGDPLPTASEKVACVIEQAAHPFLQQRNLMRVSLRTSSEGRAASSPLRLTLLLDNSGSMERPDRRHTLAKAIYALANELGPDDQVTLVSFARQPRLVADQLSGGQIQSLLPQIENLPSEGGTNFEAALTLAFGKAKENYLDSAQNRVVLLTDGAVNLGDANPAHLANIVTNMRSQGIAFDATGICADGLNDEVLEALTRNGDGRYYVIDSAEDVNDGFAEQIAGALRPSAANVKVQVEFNPQRVTNYKLLGFEKHTLNAEDFRNDQVDAAELAANEAGVAVYHYEPNPNGSGDIGTVSVRFRDLNTGQMIENRWPIPYTPAPPTIDQAAPAMQLAAISALTAAKLRNDAVANQVDFKALEQLTAELPTDLLQNQRVSQLRYIINQARMLSEK